LQAGVATIGNNTRGASISGLRETATNITQDGINVMDNFVKTSSLFALNSPSLNSTAEFSITTGTTGSDSGRGVAQVNMVTKGGTNEYHGGGFYQRLHEGADSNTFFNNQNGTPLPILRQKYYGFDIGGPVHFLRFGEGVPQHWNGKDKAFFFLSNERFREQFSVTRNRTVLTADARAGIFKYTGTNGQLQTINLLQIGTVKALNPIISAQMSKIPLPNNTLVGDGFNTAGYQFNITGSDPNDKWVFRYDHQLVKDTRLGSHKLEFVYNRAKFYSNPDTLNNNDAPFPGGQDANQSSNRQVVTGALVSNFGSHWNNVFRYGRQWAPVLFTRNSSATNPFIVYATGTSYDFSFVNQGRNTVVNQFIDDLSWVKGNHLFKFGADYQDVWADNVNDAGIIQTVNLGTPSSNGAGFTQTQLPNSVSADLTRAQNVYATIVGNLSSATQTFNVTTPTSGFVPGATRDRIFDERDLAIFAQDQWRFRSNITLSYGVRWDYMGVPTIPNGLAIQPKASDIFGVSGYGNIFKPTAPAGQPGPLASINFVSGTTGIPLYKNDWNNFAPYLGIAYSPKFKSGPFHMLFGDEGKSSIRAGFAISYLHDGFTTVSNVLGTGATNPGLIQTSTNASLTGVLQSASGIPLVPQAGVANTLQIPTFVMPTTDRGNFDFSISNGLWAFDQHLRTPYVEQWNIGYEREIFKDTAIELRYTGNHAVKTWRAVDYNETNIFENGFLQEFLNAQKNLALRGGSSFAPGCTGCVALPIFDKLFGVGTSSPVLASSAYTSSTFATNLTANNIGAMANTLAYSTTYKTQRNALPSNFFVANPNAAFVRLLSNDSMSNYNAFQAEVRRRFANGVQFQADYTFGKTLGNAVDAQGNNQSDLVSWRTLRDTGLDYRRSIEDQKHRFVANGLWELPFGKGKMLFDTNNSVVNRIVGGFTLGGIMTWSSSAPWFVNSNRSTFNSFNAANNPAQLVGITFDEFKKHVGLYKTPGGVFFIDPALLDITYNAKGLVAGSKLKAGLMAAPAPGTFGDFPINSLEGPHYFSVDMSMTKRIPITERVRFEFKVTAINLLNHPNFVFGNQTFDSSTFGLISTTRTNSGFNRAMNFIAQIRF